MTFSPSHLTRDIDPETGARRITLTVDVVAALIVVLLSVSLSRAMKFVRLSRM